MAKYLLCGAIYKFTIVSLWLILSVIEGAYRGEGKTTDNDEEDNIIPIKASAKILSDFT